MRWALLREVKAELELRVVQGGEAFESYVATLPRRLTAEELEEISRWSEERYREERSAGEEALEEAVESTGAPEHLQKEVRRSALAEWYLEVERQARLVAGRVAARLRGEDGG